MANPDFPQWPQVNNPPWVFVEGDAYAEPHYMLQRLTRVGQDHYADLVYVTLTDLVRNDSTPALLDLVTTKLEVSNATLRELIANG